MTPSLSLTLTVREADGFLRRSFPCTATVWADAGTWRPNAPVRLLESDGAERPCQIDLRQTWDDGSVCEADVAFAPFLEPYETRCYALEVGGDPARVQVRNPISVEDEPDQVIVRQGVVAYAIRKSGFNLVDAVVFQDKAFLKSGARGPVLVLKDGSELVPEGRVAIAPERKGPWMGRLRVEGAYPGGFGFVTHLTFVSSKSWYLAEHRITSGDCSRIQGLCIETHFDLPEGPLSSAFGARVRHDGTPTSWVVFTDGACTIDIAVLDAWTPGGAVRCEVGADGLFRVRDPLIEGLSRHYVHVLHGPPDDVKNTPAPAMAAELHCVQSNAKVTTS